MDSFVVRVGKPVYHPAGQQATLVFVDYFDRQAVFLRATEKGEDAEMLQEEARKMRRLRQLTNVTRKKESGKTGQNDLPATGRSGQIVDRGDPMPLSTRPRGARS